MGTWRFVAVLIFLTFVGPVSYAQTETCGAIITPAGYYDEDSEEQRSPIENCANPFNGTEGIDDFLVGEDPVANGQTITVPDTGLANYGYSNENYYQTSAQVYRHVGSDYVLANVSFAEPTDDDRRTAISEYFDDDPSQAAFYTLIYFSSDQFSYFFVDGNTFDPITDARAGRYVVDVFRDVEEYVERNVRSQRAPLPPGTYTVVRSFDDSGPAPSAIPSVRWLSWLVPTAQAAQIVQTVTFTLVTELPPEAGASSVLFLPGVMGSRLFEVTNACGADGEEHEVWVDSNECFQARMAMTSAGESINPLYTYVGRRGLVDEAYTLNYYKSFINSLDDWQDEGTIADYTIVPYDWRLKLSDTLLSWRAATTDQLLSRRDLPLREQHLYKTLAALASTSLSGKVTMVAHSNGGLVAKQFLIKLAEADDPLLAKIDNLILVAVPQVGTPEALISLLHGTDLGLGFVLDEEMSRWLLNNMPMGYHLLPNQEYFDGQGSSVSTPVIDFEAGASTTAWRNEYGDVIDRSTLHHFLGSSSGRSSTLDQDLVTPQLLNDELLAYAREIEEEQAAWQPPQTLKVYQIAGVGLSTPAKITYTTVRVCAKFISGTCIQYLWEVRPQIRTVIDGDETVVTPSALALTGNNVERWWLNLAAYNQSVFLNRRHASIIEVEDVINFVQDSVSGSVHAPYDYLTKDAPNLTNLNRLSFQLHSPLDS